MLKKWFREYLLTNKRDILIVASFIMLGFLIGVGVYIFSANSVRELAAATVKEVLEISKGDNYIKTNIVLNGIKADILLILVVAMFSVNLFGKWLIYSVALLKGAAISVYTILLFNIFGPLWGIVTTFLLVVLVNLLYLPAFIYLILSFLELHFNIFKVRINKGAVGISKLLLAVFLSFVIMFSSIIVEQITSGIMLNIYSKI